MLDLCQNAETDTVLKTRGEEKKMTIPETVDIMGIPYTVKEVDVVSRDGKEWGMIDYETQTILIDRALAPQKKGQVFTHELIHGILGNIGQYDWNEDESAVQSFAAALYHVLSSQTITFSS